MLDLKALKSALRQLEEERNISPETIIEAIEQALAAAYKKEYGKKGQIIRCRFDTDTGVTEFWQVKIVVDESIVRMEEEDSDANLQTASESTKKKEEANPPKADADASEEASREDERVRYNPEHHILLEDAQKIKSDAKLEEEITFPLEPKEDFGRIAAQTAKQVIIQRIREAEKSGVLKEYGSKEGEIVSGIIQKIDQGNVFVDFDHATGIMQRSEQIPHEKYHPGHRIKSYLYNVKETPRGVSLNLSRTHPKFLSKIFAMEVPEIADETVEIKSIAREAGNRSKIAVTSHDENVDPLGACVGQKGIRVSMVMNELSGEKIDIIHWSEDPRLFVANALSPAQVLDIEIFEKEHKAIVEVSPDQLSLAIGKGGQNVRLAAKLTGWKIDVRGTKGEEDSDANLQTHTNLQKEGEKEPVQTDPSSTAELTTGHGAEEKAEEPKDDKVPTRLDEAPAKRADNAGKEVEEVTPPKAKEVEEEKVEKEAQPAEAEGSGESREEKEKKTKAKSRRKVGIPTKTSEKKDFKNKEEKG